jgi:N-acetylmuramoyl-L-alanine amidase
MTRDLHRASSTNNSLCRHQHRSLRRGVLAALLLCAVLTSPLSGLTVARKKQMARDRFDNAERMREALNGRPAAQRSERDYQRVMDAYRKVYYLAPTSSKADAAIVAVAELLVEKGRQFNNDATLTDAVGQYEFLRKEYPGSKYRVEALFTMGQIYKDDLKDNVKARETFQEYLKRYARSQLAEDAKQALKELDEAQNQAQTETKPKAPKPQPVASKSAKPVDAPEQQDVLAAKETSKETPDEHRGTKPLVTGVRHWSTPDYTRIAIDLEDEVKYESGRIPSPDRIYFDLKDTRLSSILKGKAFDVDDGFLKKIRVAQFAPGLTRVVLEVGDDVGEYSAFLLPNPYRLVIDVHGKKSTKPMARTQSIQPAPAPKPVETIAKSEPIPAVKAPEKKPEVAKAVEPKETPVEKTTETVKVAEPKQPAKQEVAKIAEPKVSKPAEQKAAEPKQSTKTEPVLVAKEKVPTKIVEADAAVETPALSAAKKPVVIAKAMPPEPTVKDDPPLRSRGKKRSSADRLDVRTAQPTIDGDRSLIRALGLKIGRIVVDAGHGGHDTGTIGPNGLEEKDLVLDVALRLGKLLENRLGAEVVYTRDDDTFIPLETRTAIANQQQADLFISVHANSSRDQNARGVETYYLNFTSSRDALEVAARENAVSEKSIHELQDLVKKIALKEKIEESREFALDVQSSLHGGLAAKVPAIRDRGVKKAPFIVLIGANMPSILAEISFISNPADEKKLTTPDYRQKIAESLYKGVAKYVGGLSGVKVAAKMGDKEGD